MWWVNASGQHPWVLPLSHRVILDKFLQHPCVSGLDQHGSRGLALRNVHRAAGMVQAHREDSASVPICARIIITLTHGVPGSPGGSGREPWLQCWEQRSRTAGRSASNSRFHRDLALPRSDPCLHTGGISEEKDTMG